MTRASNEIIFRVCYADTDAGGVTYYGNYMRYLEQGRMELMRQMGWEVEQLHAEGIIFPVRELNVTYKSPARLGDEIRVTTRLVEVDRFALTFVAEMDRPQDGQAILEATVKIVCVSMDGRLRKVPADMKQSLDDLLS